MYVDGVFQGGGSLGAAYPGALRAPASRGIWFRRVAGTSAGAIISSMIAAGYSAAEIEYLSGPEDPGDLVVMAAGLHGGGVIQTTVPPINPYR